MFTQHLFFRTPSSKVESTSKSDMPNGTSTPKSVSSQGTVVRRSGRQSKQPAKTIGDNEANGSTGSQKQKGTNDIERKDDDDDQDSFWGFDTDETD